MTFLFHNLKSSKRPGERSPEDEFAVALKPRLPEPYDTFAETFSY
ncbi:MAG: hypothetical protein ACERLM_00915 [Acidimicrobiales bacterium]